MRLLSIICTLFFHFIGYSQLDLSYQHFTEKSGLLSNEIYQVEQDSLGYLWIISNKGISTFDGVNFEHYKNESLPLSSTIRMVIDRNNVKWFCDYTNQLFYFKNDTFKLYQNNDKIVNNIQQLNTLRNLWVDSKNDIKIGTNNGLFTIYQKLDSVGITANNIDLHVGEIDKSTPIIHFYSFRDSIHNLLQSSYSIHALSDTISFQSTCRGVESNQLKGYSYSNGDIHIYAWCNIKIDSNRSPQLYVPKDIKHRIISSLLEEDRVWIGTVKEGLYLTSSDDIDFSKGKFFFKNDLISGITKDHQGAYWVSTLNNGIYYISNIEMRTLYANSNSRISALIPTTNRSFFSIINNQSIHYKNPLHQVSTEFIFEKPYLSGQGKFDSISQQLYLPTIYSDSISSIKLNTLDSYRIIPISQSKQVINDKDQLYSLGTQIRKIIGSRNVEAAHTHLKSNCGEFDFEGNLWLASAWGIKKYNRNDTFLELSKEEFPFYKGNCKVLKFINDSTIFIGTNTDGFYFYNIHSKISQHFTTNDGLIDNRIQCIEFQFSNELWIGTKNGVSKLNVLTDSFSFINYTTSNGLLNNSIHSLLIQKDSVYAATDNGISIFSVAHIPSKQTTSRLQIVNCKVNGKKKNLDELMHLPYFENNIEVIFRYTNFKSIQSQEFRYQLSHDTSKWNTLNSNLLSLGFLASNNYSLTIQAKNELGQWAESINLVIQIARPWWKTWWFISTVTLFILGLFSLFIHLKISSFKKRQELLSELIRSKQNALLQQMNPHFIFNSLNSIQRYIFANDIVNSNRYLGIFSKLIRSNLENSQKEWISLKEEVDFQKIYLELEKLRFHTPFDFSIETIGIHDIEEILIPPFIIQPFLENSIWHGIQSLTKKGIIELKFELLEHQLLCTIQDNGIGREKSDQIKKQNAPNKESFSSKITQNRFELLSELYKKELTINYTDLIDDKENAKGTKIEITLPYRAFF